MPDFQPFQPVWYHRKRRAGPSETHSAMVTDVGPTYVEIVYEDSIDTHRVWVCPTNLEPQILIPA